MLFMPLNNMYIKHTKKRSIKNHSSINESEILNFLIIEYSIMSIVIRNAIDISAIRTSVFFK